eukprot:gnl/Chilomastix_cuspidata/1585.p1 GENE.gnl/Chilomastix_cuspidata/1585~~gnl/Chilomastix_cuspidata/1585.p1  ORF type:complete len:634 (+),score=90.25 gnl/Chilomastix_cuspidata/1585:629-2530(+)
MRTPGHPVSARFEPVSDDGAHGENLTEEVVSSNGINCGAAVVTKRQLGQSHVSFEHFSISAADLQWTQPWRSTTRDTAILECILRLGPLLAAQTTGIVELLLRFDVPHGAPTLVPDRVEVRTSAHDYDFEIVATAAIHDADVAASPHGVVALALSPRRLLEFVQLVFLKRLYSDAVEVGGVALCARSDPPSSAARWEPPAPPVATPPRTPAAGSLQSFFAPRTTPHAVLRHSLRGSVSRPLLRTDAAAPMSEFFPSVVLEPSAAEEEGVAQSPLVLSRTPGGCMNPGEVATPVFVQGDGALCAESIPSGSPSSSESENPEQEPRGAILLSPYTSGHAPTGAEPATNWLTQRFLQPEKLPQPGETSWWKRFEAAPSELPVILRPENDSGALGSLRSPLLPRFTVKQVTPPPRDIGVTSVGVGDDEPLESETSESSTPMITLGPVGDHLQEFLEQFSVPVAVALRIGKHFWQSCELRIHMPLELRRLIDPSAFGAPEKEMLKALKVFPNPHLPYLVISIPGCIGKILRYDIASIRRVVYAFSPFIPEFKQLAINQLLLTALTERGPENLLVFTDSGRVARMIVSGISSLIAYYAQYRLIESQVEAVSVAQLAWDFIRHYGKRSLGNKSLPNDNLR